jgi:Spy/CpxP family protein refolding chaperone
MSIVSRLGWRGVALVASLLFNIAFVVTALLPCCPAHEETATATRVTDADSDSSLLAGLELSEEQNAAVTRRRIETASRITQLRQQVSQARGRMWLLVAAAPLDREALAAEVDTITAAQRTIQELVVEYMAWIREQLSDPQVARFDSAVLQRMCKCPGCDGGCVQGCPGSCPSRHRHEFPGAVSPGAPSAGSCGHGEKARTCGQGEGPGLCGQGESSDSGGCAGATTLGVED